ncbi:hypothetical protein ACFVAV_34010 [Nocardia sp. NPDC057663]|uniref:hypothetical protein n=1 Tax=Nocardia sp. NPDC057663 TaxID=3346201 RepID=UPI00366AAA1F
MPDHFQYALVIELGEESPIGDVVAIVSAPELPIPRVGEFVDFELGELRLEVREVRHNLTRTTASPGVWVITRPAGPLPVESYADLDGWLSGYPAIHAGQHD